MKATFAQLRAFNAVAKAGSFVKASKKLGVTQPAVTLQVRGLEDLYSIVLFFQLSCYILTSKSLKHENNVVRFHKTGDDI